MSEHMLSAVKDLVTNRHDRSGLMQAKGMACHLPAIDFEKALADSEEQLNEDRAFEAAALRNFIAPDKEFNQMLADARAKGE